MTTRCVQKNSENIDGTPLALRKKISQDSEKLPSNPLTTFYPLEKLVFIYLFIEVACTFSSFNNVLVLLCVIFLTYMCCLRLCSHGGWLLLEMFCSWYRI